MTVTLSTAEPSSAPATTSRRRADIQGMRALAVLLVVAFHARLPIPGGFIGVDVFFVISGFVITAMLMRQWAATGRLSFRTFYFRRFLRLTPALALVVTVVALASVLLQNPYGAQQTTARTGIGAMLLSANATIAHGAGDYFASTASTNPLLNTWSLSVEEQFYLVFPALLVLGWLLARRLRRGLLPPIALIALVAAASFALSLALSYGSTLGQSVTDFFGGAQSFAFYSPFTRAWEFAAGALLALVLDRIPVLSRAAAMLTGALGAVILAVGALVIHDTMVFPGLLALLPVVGTMLLILGGTHHTAGVSALMATRPMVYIGDTSYSWYLWHWPVIVFTALLFPGQGTMLVIAALASLVPALASYRFLEQPMRHLRPRSRTGAGSVIVVTLAVPLVACGVLLAGANAGWGLTSGSAGGQSGALAGQPGTLPAGEQQVQDQAVADGEVAGGEGGSLRSQHLAVRNGCVNTPLRPRTCTFGPDNPIGTVLLAGDSQAYALADGVVAAATGLGYDTLVTSHTGCPFLGRESSGVHNYPCRSWQKSIVAHALATRPDAVIIGNLSEGYVHPETGWRTAATDSGGRADSPEEAEALWRRGLDPIVSTLRKAGIGVVIIANVPQMNGYTDGTSLLSQAIGRRDFSVNRDESEANRQPALDIEQSIAKARPGTVVYDPFPALCDDEDCWAARDGAVLYQDETHLSVDGSLLLVDGLTAAITEAVDAR